MGRRTEKKKKVGKGKKESEEVSKQNENLKFWTKADYVVGREVEIQEQFRHLLEEFEKFERPPFQGERPDVFKTYEFDEVRAKTANHDGITRVVHLVIRSLHDVLERRQIRGFHVGGTEPVLLSHSSKMVDVLYSRLFKMLRLNEKRELTPLAMGWGGHMVSYEKAKKLFLNWKSQWGELTEVEALFETLGSIVEGEDTTDNETGCVVREGELVLRRILQIKNALLKVSIEPNGQVEDERSDDVTSSEEKEVLAEKKGEIIRKQFEEDVVLGFGLKLENLTAEMDLRPDQVSLNYARGEVVKVIPTTTLCQQPLEEEVEEDVKKLVNSIEKDLLETIREKGSKTEAKELKRIEDEVKDVESIVVVLKKIAKMPEQELASQAFALYVRQCLVRMERLVYSGHGGSTTVDYARIALEDLKREYQGILVDNIEVASAEARANFSQMLVDVGLGVPYPRDSVEVEDEEPPELEEFEETDTEYEEETTCSRLGSFSILLKNTVKQYSGTGEDKKLDGTLIQERIDNAMVDDLVQALKDTVTYHASLLIIHEDEIEEAKIRQKVGIATNSDEDFVNRLKEKVLDDKVQIEKGVNQLRDLLCEINIALEIQVKRVVKSLVELGSPNLTVERCKMAMMAATTTKLKDYIEHATLESRFSDQTSQNIQTVIDCLMEIDENEVAKEVSAIVEKVKDSWKELSIHKIETFKTAIRRKEEIKGNLKKPSEEEAQAAKWLDEIEYYLEEKADPTTTAHAREIFHQTRELTEKNEVEEIIKSNYYKSEEDTRRVLMELRKHGVENCIEVIRILRRAMVRWNRGFEVIAVFSQFEDFPGLYIKYLPVNGKQRAEYLTRQLGKCNYATQARVNAKISLKKGKGPCDRSPDECEEELEKLAASCRGFSSNKPVSENNQKTVMIMVDTQESRSLTDEEFMKRLPKESYGWFVMDKNRHCQESFGEARSRYQREVTHTNSDLRCYFRDPHDEPVETLDSCGKGCLDKKQCRIKTQYPGQPAGQCGQEFVILAKDEVSAEELFHSMESFISYNGQKAKVEERAISVEGQDFISRMLIAIKPYTEVNKENAKLAIRFFEENCMFSFEPVLDGYFPKQFGLDDTEAKNRARFFFRTSLLVVPGWMGIMSWLVTNAMTETGSGDSRTTVPRWNGFVFCSQCTRRFLSPLSLLFHRIYEENAIKYTSAEEDVDHSKCHQSSVCWCRLVQPWESSKKKPSEDFVSLTREVLDGPAESSIISENGTRVYGAHRKIQLGALAYQEAGTCPISEIVNAATLLCQIKIFVRMPGKNFSKKANLALGKYWCRGSYWSNVFAAKGLKEERTGATKLMEAEWSLPEGAATKLDFRGKVVEIDLCQLFAEYVDDTENTRENENKYGSISSELNNLKYQENSEEYVSVEFIVKRKVEYLKWLENFVNIDEELILYNIVTWLSTLTGEDLNSEVSKRRSLISKFIVANYAMSCTIDGRLVTGLYKAQMKDMAPFLSRENPMSIVCIEGAGSKDLPLAKVLDFNQDPVSGEKIIQGRDLKVKVPGFKVNAEIAKLIKGWDIELYGILTRGWPEERDNVGVGLSNKAKKLPETKGKKPKVKTSFVEPERKEVKRKDEKPDLQEENIELRIQHYRCVTCAPMKKKSKRHSAPGGCFDDNPKDVRNKIRNELKTLCVEAKMRRLAREEAARQEAEGTPEREDDEEEKVEKLMESFNQSLDKEDLNEQCDIAGDLYFEIRKAAEKKMANMDADKSEQSVTSSPVLRPRESTSDPSRVVVAVNNVTEQSEDVENPEGQEATNGEVHVHNAENDSVEERSNSWCTGGVVAGQWEQCENGPFCENCRF